MIICRLSHTSTYVLDAHEMMLFDAPEELTSHGLQFILADLNSEVNAHYVVDLRPYVDTSSYAVQSTNSLSHTYNLFRYMGLRHLTVHLQIYIHIFS
jgi:hypothetical protein